MIRLAKQGTYRILETTKRVQMLTLDERNQYAWMNTGDAGGILVNCPDNHDVDYFLSVGKYRMYKVKEESDLTGLTHLELLAGDGVWQGYVLPTGLPTDKSKRNKIIPTKEVITKSCCLVSH